jgi:hypothetical protein
MILTAEADRERRLSWRVGFYAVAAAAAILAAIFAYDASGMAITDRPSIQRATTW